MDDKRILELALESLERQKAEVEEAIQELNILRGGRQSVVRTGPPSLAAAAGRTRSAVGRRQQSARTKRANAKEKPPRVARRRPKTEAEKKALSQIMKAVWARRKAGAEKKLK